MRRRAFIQSTASTLLLATGSACMPKRMREWQPMKGGTLFSNGRIYLDADTQAANLLVREGVVIGHDLDPSTLQLDQVVDLGGAALYPGFVDSHVHLVSVAAALATGVYLNGASTSQAIARILRNHCQKLPPEIPVLAHGFVLDNYDAWSLADLSELDAATGDRPVMIADQLGHSYIANSKALALSGLTGNTQAPPGGRIVMESGRPTGMLRETAGYLVGNKAIFPRIPDAFLLEQTQKLAEKWASMGYTSIIELMGGPMGRILKPGVFMELEKQGKLPLRVEYAYTFFSLEDIEGYKEAPADTERVHLAGLKLFVDGAAGNGGAWTRWVNQLNDHGLYAIWTDDSKGAQYNIHRIVEKAEHLKMDMHYHVGGDLSIEAVLQAIEGVQAQQGSLHTKHTLYHLGFITDEQIQRMKKLGSHVIAGIQPSLHWEYSKEITPKFYGEHAKGSYPYRKMRDAGLILAHGTDYASNLEKLCWPTEIMKAALTGGGDPTARPPLTIRDMIQGFTVGGFATTQAQKIGTLHGGNKADMVIYSQDLSTVPPEQLSKDKPKVLATYVAGRKVFSAS